MAPSSLDNALPLEGPSTVAPLPLRARRVLSSLWHIRKIFTLQKAPDPSRPKDTLSVWFEDFLFACGFPLESQTTLNFPI